MRVRVKIGDVSVDVEGMELSKRQVVDLMERVTTMAMLTQVEVKEVDAEQRYPIGFSATIERAPEYQEQDLSWYFEE